MSENEREISTGVKSLSVLPLQGIETGVKLLVLVSQRKTNTMKNEREINTGFKSLSVFTLARHSSRTSRRERSCS